MSIQVESKSNMYRKNKKFAMMALSNIVALIKQKNVRVLNGQINVCNDFDEIPGRYGIVGRKESGFKSFKLEIEIYKPVKKSTKK